MKMITAVIKPFKLEDVRQALLKQGINGLTVSEVKGFGRQQGKPEIDHGEDYQVAYLPKIKVEVAVSDSKTEAVKKAIMEAASTGHIGDGKIFVMNHIEEVIRIRTGERNEEAL